MDTLKLRRAYAGESLGQKAKRLSGLVARVVFIITLMGSGVLTEVRPTLAQAANVTVAITAPDTVIPGSDFTANVTISQVQNFDAANFDVSFNPAVLRLDNVTSGNIGGVAVPVDVWNQREPGRFTIIVNIPGLAGASGSGYLAVLRFYVVGSAGQSSTINLSNGSLSNTLAEAIPATWTGDSVSVISVVPSGQELPPPPPSLPETTSNESGATSTEPEATSTEPETISTEPGATTTEPEATTTEPEATAEKELPPTAALSPESETIEASGVTLAPPPPPPAAKVGQIDWPVVGGAIGGGIIVIGLIIFLLVRRSSY